MMGCEYDPSTSYRHRYGATTFSLTTLTIMDLFLTLKKKTLRIKDTQNTRHSAYKTLSIKDTQHNDIQHNGLSFDTQHKRHSE
jgi:hypothetical protein